MLYVSCSLLVFADLCLDISLLIYCRSCVNVVLMADASLDTVTGLHCAPWSHVTIV